MNLEAAAQILGFPFENIYLVMIFSILRMFGLSFSFLAFGWGLGSGVLMRVNIAIVLSIPIMASNFGDIIDVAQNSETLDLVLLAAKEFAIGFGIGLLASSPFRALQYAGGIADTFRGETDSGIQAPDSTPLQTMSLLYLIIGFSVFFHTGGLWKLIENLYQSYAIWPVNQTLPGLYGGAAEIALLALDRALELALVIIAPVMILLVSVEVILMIAAKLGKRFGLYEQSFLLKNLITIVTLPLMAIIIIRVAEEYVPTATFSINVMQTYFK